MKGRQILIEPLPAGGHAAALMVDGRLEDLLVDPDPADPAPYSGSGPSSSSLKRQAPMPRSTSVIVPFVPCSSMVRPSPPHTVVVVSISPHAPFSKSTNAWHASSVSMRCEKIRVRARTAFRSKTQPGAPS